MHLSALVSALLVSTAFARNSKHAGRDLPAKPQRAHRVGRQLNTLNGSSPLAYGSSSPKNGTIIPQNMNTTKFAVDGSSIPNVTWNAGESYAGLLPISDKANASELYFWFFPTANPDAEDEILIWLNGGPGCSSLEGFLQENGPFTWQYGTFLPVQNQYTWVNLTNVLWVEQPAGTGFSQLNGNKPPADEIEMAAQFLGFFKNFVDTFNLHNKKIYVTGESYAGFYVPYIADAMHNASDTTYYGIESILFYDPIISYNVVQTDLVAVPFVDTWAGLFSFNKSYTEDLHARAKSCGYDSFINESMVFPPKGPLATPPNVDYSNPNCSLWNEITYSATTINPCWDEYQVATTCPLLWDVLGFPGSIPYLPDGADIYFNRSDVQRAINAPQISWEECTDGILANDTSTPSALSVLPRVIEKNKKTIIAHGALDFVLISNGTLLAIQNMTWNGSQGFSTPPSKWNDFYVPAHSELSLSNLAGSGIFGSWHTERGLTFCTVDLSGHMIPQYAPSASYRQLEFLLGRIDSLGVVSDFTTQRGNFGNGANITTSNSTMRMF